MFPPIEIQTELIRSCFFPFKDFKISSASFLLLGLEIIFPFKSITLSAPITNSFGNFALTLFAFNSAKFLDIISGEALSLVNDILTLSSSTFDGTTLQRIPFVLKISFLTLLFEAKIISGINLTINFVDFNNRCGCFFNRFSCYIYAWPTIFFKSFFSLIYFFLYVVDICILCVIYFF